MGSGLGHDVLNEAVDDLPALIHTWRVSRSWSPASVQVGLLVIGLFGKRFDPQGTSGTCYRRGG